MTTLKAALQEACFMELEDIPSEEVLSTDETLTFFAAFERSMKKLIRWADHPIRYRVAKAAACILLAALLSGCTALAISPEACAPFVGWVREVYESWFMYRYTGEEQPTPENTVFKLFPSMDSKADMTVRKGSLRFRVKSRMGYFTNI